MKTYIEIPQKAKQILDVLHAHGYEAYVVGGCVRDSILGRKPEDWDVTTSASPCEVKALFPATIDTGIEHGTVTVMLDQEGFEVTTYRVDGKYEDCRHPKEVVYTSSLSEDLKRRDFTINAMAYSGESGLVDEFGGREDLQRKVIRCVGSPQERFSEDALRMLRAVRFAAQLGFTLADDVKRAISEMADRLERISAERIQVELVKLLVSPNPHWLRLAYECGITAVILPEFDRIMVQHQNNPHHIFTTGEHTLLAMQNIPADKVLRLTMLFHDMGKPEVCRTDEDGRDHFRGHAEYSAKIVRKVMKRLKFDNDTTRRVYNLVANHSWYPKLNAASVRMCAHRIGPDQFDQFLLVKRADILGQNPEVIQDKINYLSEVEHIWRDIRLHDDCMSLRQLQICGSDLIADGMRPGPELGVLLDQLLERVLEHPEWNKRETLLTMSRELRTKPDAH